MNTSLGGRVALVTGGNHGIGAATAEALAAEGVAVFITFLRLPDAEGGSGEQARGRYARIRAEASDEAARRIRDRGGRADAWEADLADPATIPDVFDRAEAALGPVDVLVNNADHCTADTFRPAEAVRGPSPGGMPMGPLTPESYDRHVAVNCRATALMMAEFARRHAARGASWGRIVNLSTDGAPVFPGEVSYGATKYAIESLSRSAAVELGPYGITVNVVSPGPIQTGYMTEEMEHRAILETPLGRLGEPADVADVIVLLVSERARWLTGQILYAGGGHRMI